ncbi:MAG: hypothetical protein AAF682_20055 [Planctomycetota bacterium]
MNQPRLLPLLGLLFLAAPAAAQMPWETGPYQVGLRPHAYFTPKSSSPFGAVFGRSFYPALGEGLDAPPDVAGGPYPHIAFLHGHTLDTSHYVVAMQQLASWGFIVTGCDTNVGFIEPAMVAELADDQLLLMNLIEAEDAPGGFWEGMFDGGDWGVVGHSMGGATLPFFTSVAPRVTAASSHQPYLGDLFGGSFPASTSFASYDGSLVVIGATEDTLTPWDTMCLPWYQAATSASRRVFTLVDGMGHLGLVDVPQTGDPMTAEEQDRITNLWMTGYFRAELYGETHLFDLLLGEAAQSEPWTLESGGSEPLLWATTSAGQPGSMGFGVAGDYGELVLVGLAPQPASIPSVWGTIGIDLATSSVLFSGNLGAATGLTQQFAPIPGTSGVPFYLQALQLPAAGGGELSPVVTYVAP